MTATLTIATKASASLSYRVAIRRNSLSLATARSTTLRRRYADLLKRPQRSRSCTCSLSRIGITGLIPHATSPSRIRSALYPLSAASFLGRLPGLLAMAEPSSDPRILHSLRLPRVQITCRTLPRPSVITCSLEPNPPRQRPKPWSGGSLAWDPFFPRSSSMPGGADGSGVGVPLGPVDQAFGIGLHAKSLQHAFPGAVASPAQVTS